VVSMNQASEMTFKDRAMKVGQWTSVIVASAAGTAAYPICMFEAETNACVCDCKRWLILGMGAAPLLIGATGYLIYKEYRKQRCKAAVKETADVSEAVIGTIVPDIDSSGTSTDQKETANKDLEDGLSNATVSTATPAGTQKENADKDLEDGLSNVTVSTATPAQHDHTAATDAL